MISQTSSIPMNIVSCIEFTPVCNWSCEYCIAGTQKGKYKDFTDEQFDIILKFVSETKNPIVISGGEPGLLGIDKLVKIFDVLINFEHPIYINTNGTFINLFAGSVLTILREKYTSHLVNKLLSNITIRYHLYESLTRDFNYDDINQLIKAPVIRNLSGRANTIANRLLILKKIGVATECQVVFTKNEQLNAIIQFIKFYRVLSDTIFRNFPLVISPYYSSNKNKETKDKFGFGSIELLRLLKDISKELLANDISTVETTFAFQEALGEIKVKYKLHDTTSLWKRMKNE